MSEQGFFEHLPDKPLYQWLHHVAVNCRVEFDDPLLPKLRDAAIELARAPAPWTMAKLRSDQLLEDEDYDGETLADGKLRNWLPDATKPMTPLAEFHQVPKPAWDAVASLVREVMAKREAANPGWATMPVGWTSTYAMVVNTILAACDVSGFVVPDGQGRLWATSPPRGR